MMSKHKQSILIAIVLLLSIAINAQEVKQEQVKDSVLNLKKATKYILGGVAIKGNNRFSEQSIKAFAGLTEGEDIKIPGDELSSAIKKLWKSDLFSNVDVYVAKIDGKTIYLEFDVKELSKIGEVTIKGLRKGKTDDLAKEIEFKKGAMLTENLVTTTKNYIQDKFKEKGFLKTKVNITTKLDTISNTMKALIAVDKGEKVKIKNFRFHGNEALTYRKLRKTFKKTKQKFPLRFWRKSKFIDEDYEAGLENLISKYQENGYRDALIVSDSISWNDDNTINLDINLVEGKQYKFGDIKFLGNTVFTDDQLEAFLGLHKGDTYNGKLLAERVNGDGSPDSQDIANTYFNRGYMFSNVTPVETGVKDNVIDIEIRIHEDEQATVKNISVIGNDKTNDHVIYRELHTRPGDLFSKEAIIRSVREISQLGFFDAEAVSPDVKPNYAEKTVDIEYSVAEKGSSQIELQGGYGGGAFIGTLGLSFSNFSIKNIFNKKAYKPIPMGDGQRLSVRFQASKYSSTYSFSFTEPWLGGKKPKSLSFSIYNSKQYKYDYASRDVDKNQKIDILGASLGINQRLKWPDDYFMLSTSLNYQRYTLKNYYFPTFNFDNGSSNNLSFAVSLSRSSQGPNPIYPTKGSQFSIGAKLTPPYSLFQDKDYTTISNEEKYKWLEFYKASFSGKWYNEISKKLVLLTSAEFGFLGAYNDELGISPFERFYVGGDGLGGGYQYDGRQTIGLRGYPNSSLTPNGGGTVYDKFVLEMRYPITLKPSASIYVLGFLEGGNTYDDINKFDPFLLKRSAGLGLRLFMPSFGLLGIDFAHGFDDVPAAPGVKSGWQTHFTIGQQF
jgi:outer membrane protein insertion porin family